MRKNSRIKYKMKLEIQVRIPRYFYSLYCIVFDIFLKQSSFLRDQLNRHSARQRREGQGQDPIAAKVLRRWKRRIGRRRPRVIIYLERRGTSSSSRLGTRILRTMESEYGNKAGHLAANQRWLRASLSLFTGTLAHPCHRRGI